MRNNLIGFFLLLTVAFSAKAVECGPLAELVSTAVDNNFVPIVTWANNEWMTTTIWLRDGGDWFLSVNGKDNVSCIVEQGKTYVFHRR